MSNYENENIEISGMSNSNAQTNYNVGTLTVSNDYEQTKPGFFRSFIGFLTTIPIITLTVAMSIMVVFLLIYSTLIPNINKSAKIVFMAAFDEMDSENDHEVSKALEAAGYTPEDLYPDELIEEISTAGRDLIINGKRPEVDYSSLDNQAQTITKNMIEYSVKLCADEYFHNKSDDDFEDINEFLDNQFSTDVKAEFDIMRKELFSEAELSDDQINILSDKLSNRIYEEVSPELTKLINEEIKDEIESSFDSIMEEYDNSGISDTVSDVFQAIFIAVLAILFIWLLFVGIQFLLYKQKHRPVRNLSISFFFASVFYGIMCFAFVMANNEMYQTDEFSIAHADQYAELAKIWERPFFIVLALNIVLTLVTFVYSRMLKKKEKNA